MSAGAPAAQSLRNRVGESVTTRGCDLQLSGSKKKSEQLKKKLFNTWLCHGLDDLGKSQGLFVGSEF